MNGCIEHDYTWSRLMFLFSFLFFRDYVYDTAYDECDVPKLNYEVRANEAIYPGSVFKSINLFREN